MGTDAEAVVAETPDGKEVVKVKRNGHWHNVKAVRHGDQLSFGERAADVLKHSFGSWAFLIALNGFIVAWIVINSVVLKNGFDPYPFILLNLGLSWLAAQQGGALQIAANRGDRIASEVALHTERTADELLGMNRRQLEILDRLRELQDSFDELDDKDGSDQPKA